jgi:hypothetical protein
MTMCGCLICGREWQGLATGLDLGGSDLDERKVSKTALRRARINAS